MLVPELLALSKAEKWRCGRDRLCRGAGSAVCVRQGRVRGAKAPGWQCVLPDAG